MELELVKKKYIIITQFHHGTLDQSEASVGQVDETAGVK